MQELAATEKSLSEQFLEPIQVWKIAGLPKPTTEVFAYIHPKRQYRFAATVS